MDLQNNNLRDNNMYFSCPALMSDGRASINTDYRPKNDAFLQLRGDMTNSYLFRENLQNKEGAASITNNTSNYTVCNPVPFGTSTFPVGPITLGSKCGNFKDSFVLIN